MRIALLASMPGTRTPSIAVAQINCERALSCRRSSTPEGVLELRNAEPPRGRGAMEDHGSMLEFKLSVFGRAVGTRPGTNRGTPAPAPACRARMR